MGKSLWSSLCLVRATGLLCGLAINCFPKPLAGSAKLWSSLMVKMLVAVGLGRGVFRVLVLSEKNEPLVRGNLRA